MGKKSESTARWVDVCQRRAFELQVGSLQLLVWRSFSIHDTRKWVATCEPFFKNQPLGGKTFYEAACQAKAVLQVYLEEAMSALVEPSEME